MASCPFADPGAIARAAVELHASHGHVTEDGGDFHLVLHTDADVPYSRHAGRRRCAADRGAITCVHPEGAWRFAYAWQLPASLATAAALDELFRCLSTSLLFHATPRTFALESVTRGSWWLDATAVPLAGTASSRPAACGPCAAVVAVDSPIAPQRRAATLAEAAAARHGASWEAALPGVCAQLGVDVAAASAVVRAALAQHPAWFAHPAARAGEAACLVWACATRLTAVPQLPLHDGFVIDEALSEHAEPIPPAAADAEGSAPTVGSLTVVAMIDGLPSVASARAGRSLDALAAHALAGLDRTLLPQPQLPALTFAPTPPFARSAPAGATRNFLLPDGDGAAFSAITVFLDITSPPGGAAGSGSGLLGHATTPQCVGAIEGALRQLVADRPGLVATASGGAALIPSAAGSIARVILASPNPVFRSTALRILSLQGAPSEQALARRIEALLVTRAAERDS